MAKQRDGRNPSSTKLRAADRVQQLSPAEQRSQPTALPADHAKLEHINTYGSLPECHIDLPFVCRR